MPGLDHEEVTVRTDRRSGLPVILAIDSAARIRAMGDTAGMLLDTAGQAGTAPAQAALELASRHLGAPAVQPGGAR